MLVSSLGIYFVSGFAALIYQVIWQRLLVIFSGADVHSATLVVGAFMAGLGCGSVAGGYIADRVSPRASVALFAIAEVAVAAFGLASSTLFYDVLYQRFGHVGLGLGPTAAVLFAVLLWPTFFMGASLPVLSRALTKDLKHAAPTIGWLYGVNTIGAALGALAATWVLLPQLGLDGGLQVAAGLNLVCAIAVVPIARAASAVRADRSVDVSLRRATGGGDLHVTEPIRHWSPSFVAWTLLCAASGFLGLSLEIVWFRVLGVMVKSASFTFGTLLAVYLFGLGVGGTVGGLAVKWLNRPAAGYLTLQAAAGLYAVLSVLLFVVASGELPALEWFVEYFARSQGVDVRSAISEWLGLTTGAADAKAAFVRLYILLPVVFIGPSSILAGASFPLLQRVVQHDLTHLGQRLGILLAANIIGSTLGAFVTGWILLDVLGTAGTLKLLLALSASFGFAALARALRTRSRALRLATYTGGIALVVALVLVLPGQTVLWARLHGTSPSLIIFEEDRSGVSVLKAEHYDFRRVVVFVNGLHQSWIPYGDLHTVLGALPAFAHPSPRSAAVIGLGSGDTLYALAGRRQLERITSIEIVRPQLATLRELMRRERYPGLMAVLGDRRIEHVFGDGRLHIRRSGRQYDIIEADALRPMSAYAGNLYSESYFNLLREHLTPDGLAVTWAPTPRIARTFVKVFPHVWQHDDVMMGSNAPIRVDGAAIVQRLTDPSVRSYYDWAGVDIVRLLQPYLNGGRYFDPSHDRSTLVDLNTDLHPRDEFDIPALMDLSAVIKK